MKLCPSIIIIVYPGFVLTKASEKDEVRWILVRFIEFIFVWFKDKMTVSITGDWWVV